MSLNECFERIGPEVWKGILGWQDLLYMSFDKELTPEDYANECLRGLIGFLTGRISPASVCRHHLSENRISKAFIVLSHTSADQRRPLEDEIASKLNELRSTAAEIISDFDQRTTRALARNISKEQAAELTEIRNKLVEVSRMKLPSTVDLASIRINEEYLSEIEELGEFIKLLETDVTAHEMAVMREGFDLSNRIIEEIRPSLENPGSTNREVFEKCFYSLPELVLTGQNDLLRLVLSQLESEDKNGLRELDILDRPHLQTMMRPKLTDAAWDEHILREHISIPLRSASEEYLKSTPPLDGEFVDGSSLRTHIEERLRKTKTQLDAGQLLLAGSKKLALIPNAGFSDLRARGFAEIAEHELLRRRYNLAFDLFVDSFNLHVAAGVKDYFAERKLVTGMVMAAWLPRKMVVDHGISITDIVGHVFKEPKSMLDNIVDRQDLDILFHVVDSLDDPSSLRSFIHFLNETCSTINWVQAFLDRIMQPRLFLRNPKMGVLQIRAIMENNQCLSPLYTAVQAIGATLENAYTALSVNDIAELENHRSIVANSASRFEGKDKATHTSFLENIDQIIEAIKEKVVPATEILFTVRPVSTVFFLEERSEGIELILTISMAEGSLPIGAFSVQARIDEKSKDKSQDFISFDCRRIDVGPIDPGTNLEVVFELSVNPDILLNFSSVTIAFDCFDGPRVVKAVDKKQSFNFSFRGSRKGSKYNPYVAGPALERGGLYVGRERELELIKSLLIGQNQDNVPLILGIRRIGKTSLLKRLMSDVDITRKYIPLFYDLQDMPPSDTTSDFLKKICVKVHQVCGDKGGVYFSREMFDDDPFEAFESYITSFQNAPASKRVLIVLDEFEKLVANLAQWRMKVSDHSILCDPRRALVPEVFGALRKVMLHSQHFSFIISGLPIIKSSFEEYQARWFGLMSPLYLKPLQEEDAKRLIVAEDIPYKVSSEAVREILYMTGMQPYLLQLICQKLFTNMIMSGRETASKLDVERVVEEQILPHESYFADYYRLMGNEMAILKAIALCHKKSGKKLRYASISEILEMLSSLGKPLGREALTERLHEMEQADRPLVYRSPSSSESYRIIIGILGKRLEGEVL